MQEDDNIEMIYANLLGEQTAPGEQPYIFRNTDLVSRRLQLHRKVVPSPDSVDGEQLLDDVFASIKRYVVAEDDTLRAATLWSIHTWLMDVWTVSPIANITAPDMRCGKTLLLQVLEELVCRPLSTSNITPAAMFRMAHLFQPTLLIDEVDSFLRGNDDARGMLNSGFYKKNAFVVRCGGQYQEPEQFSMWCPKALCGIGSLTATLADRSIVLRLRRKLSNEETENLRRSDPEQWAQLRSRILRWAIDHRDTLIAYVPQPISIINDRASDCWEPLLSIAELAGSKWGAFARSAAEALQEGEVNVPSAALDLLQAVSQRISSRNPKWYSSMLLEFLLGERRWARFNQGRPLTARQLAGMLREFGINAKPIRIGDSAGKNGYELSSCEDAFARYLPAEDDGKSTLQLAA